MTKDRWPASASLLAIIIATSAASEPALAQAQSGEPVATLNELVVTAQRREERLQDVPLSVSAFSDDFLERAAVRSTKDLQQITPGLTFTQSAFAPAPTIRGVGTRSAQIGDEAVVPQYIDGVYQPFLFGLINDFNNIERVEVLRGPQSALYGRNAVGGAINVVTRTPTAEPQGEVRVGYGRFEELRFDSYLSGGTDLVASDIAIHYRRDDGYIRDISTGKNIAAVDLFGVRSKTVITPNDKFDVTVTLGYANTIDGTSAANHPIDGNSVGVRLYPNVLLPTGRYDAALTFNPSIKVMQTTGAVTGVYHGDNFSVTSITGASSAKLKGGQDTDSTPAPVAAPIFAYKDMAFSQEVYATFSPIEAMNVIVGGVYFRDVAKNAPSESQTASTTPATLRQVTASTVLSRMATDSYAAYGQVDYDLTSQFKVIVAGRYTTESRDFTTIGYSRNLTLGTQAIAAAPPPASKTWSKFTPSATLQYNPAENLQIYVRAANGFKSGIFSSATTNTTPVDPETIWQYEVGLKTSISPRLTVNLAAYYAEQKDVQISARNPTTGLTFLQNAASTEIKGIEAEIFARPLDRLNVRLAASYNESTFKDFPGAVVNLPQTAVNPPAATPCIAGTGAPLGGNRTAICDVSGLDVPRSPRFVASVGADYTIPVAMGEVVIAGNYYYQDKMYWDPLNRIAEPSYSTLAGRISWAPTERYEIAVWGSNLTEAHPALSVASSATGDNRIETRPRSYGVELTARF